MNIRANFAQTRMASARNIHEKKTFRRESSFKKTIKEPNSAKNTNDYLKNLIDQKEFLSKEQIFLEMIKILKNKQVERNPLEIKFLIYALANIKFFQKTALEMGRKTYEKLCNFIDFAFYKEGEIIFNIGDKGEKFYVILKGKVGIQIRIAKDINNNGEKTRMLSMSEIAVLGAGDGFGELALLNDSPRLATIVCKEDSYFGTLNKEPFRAILADNEKEKINNKINFLQSVPAFSRLRTKTIATLIYHFRPREFFKDMVVYKEGDDPKHVFIIKNGEFKISKNAHPPNLPPELINKAQTAPTKKIDIALLGTKEIFGEEEIIYNMKKRDYTITCSTLLGEVFMITKEDFYKRIILTKQEGLDIMEDMLQMKKKLHNKLFIKNENFQKFEIKSNNQVFSDIAEIFKEIEIPHLSQKVAKARSSCYRRVSQISSDFMQRINNFNEKNEYIYQPKINMIRSSIYDQSALEIEEIKDSHRKNKTPNKTTREKLIQPNLNAYLEFIDKKWKELKKNKTEIVEQNKDEILACFSSDRKSYRTNSKSPKNNKNQKNPLNFEILRNLNSSQKNRVDKDVSHLNMNFKQIILKLMDTKRNDEDNHSIVHLAESYQKKKKRPMSLHRIKPKNLEFLDEPAAVKKDSGIENLLSVKKFGIRNYSLS